MSKSKTTFMFPGQGSQQPGMATRVLQVSPSSKKIFDEANEVLNFNLLKLCTLGTEEELTNTIITQPAIVTTSLVLLNALNEAMSTKGDAILPTILSGHSLGLLTAAIASNCLTFTQGIEIASKRADIMQKNYSTSPLGMTSIIGLNINQVTEICNEATQSDKERVDIANLNLSNQFVVSGHLKAIHQAETIAKNMHAKVISLKLKVSSHTELHKEQSNQFAEFLRDYDFVDPDTPILSNISSKLLDSAEKIKNELSNQIHKPVYWYKNMEILSLEKISHFIEIGPGHTLSRLVKRYNLDATTLSIAKEINEPIPFTNLLNMKGNI
ncbi:MAG: ACP S-malonyltransferase [Dehalococcoidia bacterium]|nr:ACP S-malonyltransferase [Dehalococcoidia bacterium]